MEGPAWGQGSCSKEQEVSMARCGEGCAHNLRRGFSTPDCDTEQRELLPSWPQGTGSFTGCPHPTALQSGKGDSLALRSSQGTYSAYHKKHVLQKMSVARYSEDTWVHCASGGKISTAIEIEICI